MPKTLLGGLLWERGVSQSELARALGVDSSVVHLWVVGKRDIPASRVEALAAYFDVSPQDVVREYVPPGVDRADLPLGLRLRQPQRQHKREIPPLVRNWWLTCMACSHQSPLRMTAAEAAKLPQQRCRRCSGRALLEEDYGARESRSATVAAFAGDTLSGPHVGARNQFSDGNWWRP